MISVIVFLLFISLVQFVNAEIPKDQFVSDIIEISSELDPMERMEKLEGLLKEASPYQRWVILPKLSKTAVEAADFSKAQDYANQLLNLADTYKHDWNYGNAIHDANIVMGMVCLSNDSIEEAKKYLLNAGHAPISPQIRTFGPSMILADALIDRGESNVVIEYLELIKKIWLDNDGRLDSWISAIKGGGKPYFGENLRY